jgi:hypothetical protein
MSKLQKALIWVFLPILTVVIMYIGIACGVFEWRNPLCNEMAFFRHFQSVITFKQLPQYQCAD